MNARFLHRQARNNDAAGFSPEAVAFHEAIPATIERACCCPSRPAVRVVMPPSPARGHETELLLCGHHYRASRETLIAASAVVHQLFG